MQNTFVTAKSSKLPWIDQFVFLPGGIFCCIMSPVIAVIWGEDHLAGLHLSTWLLIGIGLLILAVIASLAHFWRATGRDIPREESVQGGRRGIP